MPLLTSLLTGIELPFLHRVTRHIPDDGLSDIPRSVRDALNASGVAERLLPNGEVAIGVGSRGIAGLPQIVRATVDWFRERGRGLFLSRAWEATAGPQPKDSSACWSIWA